MTATNHGLTGAAIAIALRNYPGAAIPLAFFSHFLLDSLPHFGDKKLSHRSKVFFKRLTVDATVAVIVTLLVVLAWPEIWWLVIICAFAAASPDLAWYYYYYLRPKAKQLPLSRFHTWIQWSETPKGIIVEIIWFLAFLPSLVFYGIK